MTFDERINEYQERQDFDWIVEKLKEAVEVVKFYGHEPNWQYDPDNARPEISKGWDEAGNTEATFDYGDKARAFLKGLGE